MRNNKSPTKRKTAWVDIINPPQVKYLAPLAHALKTRGYNTFVTARDFSSTLPLLLSSGIHPIVIGRKHDSKTSFRLLDNLVRSAKLIKLLSHYPHCEFLITGSRSASLAARFRNIPDFAFCDYEFAELKSHRLIGSRMVFPSVIPKQFFENLGFSNRQLLEYNGIKEDITFCGEELKNSLPFALPDRFSDKVIVLLRPPATETHYFNSHSASLYQMVLEELSSIPNVGLLFSPRYQSQQALLNKFDWLVKPLVLDTSSDMLSLLRTVDFVVSSGGTMVREAAYHKVKAISILAGNACSVDSYLESRRLLKIVRTREEFREALVEEWQNVNVHPRNTNIIPEILDKIILHLNYES